MYQCLLRGQIFPNYFFLHINVFFFTLIHINTKNEFIFRYYFFKIFSNTIIEIPLKLNQFFVIIRTLNPISNPKPYLIFDPSNVQMGSNFNMIFK
jgi:hypothetical protein